MRAGIAGDREHRDAVGVGARATPYHQTPDDAAPAPGALAAGMAPILRHSAAQRAQAAAHSWQCCIGCLPHSPAHMSHKSAHAWHNSSATSLPRATNPAAIRHNCAQSISSAMQRVIIFGSGSRRQAAAQRSHASAHWLQASIHESNWPGMGFSLKKVANQGWTTLGQFRCADFCGGTFGSVCRHPRGIDRIARLSR